MKRTKVRQFVTCPECEAKTGHRPEVKIVTCGQCHTRLVKGPEGWRPLVNGASPIPAVITPAERGRAILRLAGIIPGPMPRTPGLLVTAEGHHVPACAKCGLPVHWTDRATGHSYGSWENGQTQEIIKRVWDWKRDKEKVIVIFEQPDRDRGHLCRPCRKADPTWASVIEESRR